MVTLRRYGFFLFLLAALSGALFFRTIHPAADPFSDTFIDTQDEGLHSYAARNYYLYGKWTVDSLDYGAIMPIYPRLQLPGLYLFGFHNYAFRAASVIASGASVVLIGLLVYAEWGTLPGAAAASYMAVHHFPTGVSRSALPEGSMVFFSLVTFLVWLRTLRANDKAFLWGIASGIAAMLAFFTKQSSAPIIGMMAVTYVYSFMVSPDKRKHVRIGAGVLSVLCMAAVLYILCVYMPNKDIWLANYKATVGGNRPRKALIIPSYLASQIMSTVRSPFWGYIPVLAILSLTAVAKAIMRTAKTRRLPPVDITLLAWVWLGLFVIYMISVPDRYARFLMISVPPMIILTSSFLRRKGMVATIVAVVVIVDLIGNISANVRTIAKHPTYAYKNAAEELYGIVGDHPGIYPIHWIINERFNAMSTYTADVGDAQFKNYFNRYGWPEYVSLTDAQIDDFKKRAPYYLSRLVRVKRIQNYTLFRLARY